MWVRYTLNATYKLNFIVLLYIATTVHDKIRAMPLPRAASTTVSSELRRCQVAGSTIGGTARPYDVRSSPRSNEYKPASTLKFEPQKLSRQIPVQVDIFFEIKAQLLWIVGRYLLCWAKFQDHSSSKYLAGWAQGSENQILHCAIPEVIKFVWGGTGSQFCICSKQLEAPAASRRLPIWQ
jgi:hypothetical protein